MNRCAIHVIALAGISLCTFAVAPPARAQLNPLDLETVRSQAAVRGLVEEPAAAAPATLAQPPPAADAAELLGTDPAAADEPPMFGRQLFRSPLQSYGVGFNPEYMLAIGDRLLLRIWGSFTHESVQAIDAQGNVFVPNVGPVRLAGVRNNELNAVVGAAVRRVYRDNVEVYASLEMSQPVRLFVTGFVRAPGQYPGAAAESVLGYLARAGGIDPNRGSYIDVRLLRNGQERAAFDLYEFLIDGRLAPVQLQDGDTLVVAPRHNAVRVTGDVFNAYSFEFRGESVPAAEVLELARPRPGATHVSITHRTGGRQFGEYYALDALAGKTVAAGDELAVITDRTVATILVRVDGAIESSRVLTLPYGSRLRDALALVQPTVQAQPEAIQLYRTSVAERQREMLDVSLRALESYALNARSATSEEASLRAREAEQITRFIERARLITPRGQVVLAGRETAMDTLLSDGDVLVVPERSSLVLVHGEVTQPNAIAYDSRSSVMDYVRLAGGATQRGKNSRVLLLRRDGSFEEDDDAQPRPGDEILVLPKVGTKNVEVARGITQILYQLAVAARVVVDL